MSRLSDPAVDAALSAAARLLGMELVFLSEVSAAEFRFSRLRGAAWPGISEGTTLPRQDSLCHRLLAGAPAHTADAAHDPAYADAPARTTFGIASYVGVPIVDGRGRVLGTLCGIDRRRVEVPEPAVAVLHALAEVIAARLAGPAVIRRAAAGWTVDAPAEPDEAAVDDLVTAMTLADLLSDEADPGVRPPRAGDELDDRGRLELSVRQLQHALAARVTVEQAIGVLAERQSLPPRAAFERLRKCARARGRRVHELAGEIVASSTDRSVPLPPELAGRR